MTSIRLVCIVGPMIGRNPGHVTQQGEVLASHLASEGYRVVATSGSPNRYRRLAEIVLTLLRLGRRVDTVIVQVYGGPSFVVEDVASFIARAFGRRVLMHLHGGALPEFVARHPRWSRRVLGRARVLVTPTEYLARTARQFGPVEVIPNIIDLSSYPFRLRQRAAPRIFWMRSFQDMYNPFLALAVLQRVRAEFPEASLVMAGRDNGLQPGVERRAHELGMGGAVRFPGFLNHAGKLTEGSLADIFLSTSHVDNTPVAVIEAAALGLPVISTDVGGLRDLIADGETGLLAPDNDADGLAAAVLRVVREPELAERLSRNGRRVAEQSSWAVARERWAALLGGAA